MGESREVLRLGGNWGEVKVKGEGHWGGDTEGFVWDYDLSYCGRRGSGSWVVDERNSIYVITTLRSTN